MLDCAIVFFVIALFAALFGFTGVVSSVAGIAQFLFLVFLMLAVAAFLASMFRGNGG